MDKPPPSSVQNPIRALISKDYPDKAKGMSFFAFVFSVVIYITIFYIFNLSPSNLFNDSKFWFFISNTLIIIIAVDYGAFSSSKRNIYKHDYLYDEYITIRRQSSVPLSHLRHQEIINIYPREDVEEFQEKRVVTHEKIEAPDRRLSESSKEIIPRSPTTAKSQGKRLESSPKRYNSRPDNDYQKNGVEKMLHRSRSKIAKRVVFDESKNVIRQVEREKLEPLDHDVVEEKNKYANLSDEELNKRVEEFIERSNREIRLQR